MTLQRAHAAATDAERSIAVNAKVVRAGADGVGLAFLPTAPIDSHRVGDSINRTADAKMLHQFFRQVHADKGRQHEKAT
jgi:hypothetical protein